MYLKWLIFYVLLMIAIIINVLSFFDRQRAKKAKKFLVGRMEMKSNGPHSAIVIVDKFNHKNPKINQALNWHNELIYSVGIDHLVKWHRKKGMPYKVYAHITKEDFRKIVGSIEIKNIHIFGHGKKTKLRFNRRPDDYLNYSEFIGYPKKKIINQFHCNGGNNLLLDLLRVHYDRGISLTSILGAKGFQKEGLLFSADIRKYIEKKISTQVGNISTTFINIFSTVAVHGRVAQPGRARRSQRRGPEFKSRRVHLTSAKDKRIDTSQI